MILGVRTRAYRKYPLAVSTASSTPLWYEDGSSDSNLHVARSALSNIFPAVACGVTRKERIMLLPLLSGAISINPSQSYSVATLCLFRLQVLLQRLQEE
jgi:hypothetical protein